jgi:hypothetical protein
MLEPKYLLGPRRSSLETREGAAAGGCGEPRLDTRGTYNDIVVIIPELISISGSPWDVLPPGVHVATLAEIKGAFAYNPWRRTLLGGLIDASVLLARAGCRTILLDGSYVSSKALPADYDACWEPQGVDFGKLDPVFKDFNNGRASQKAKFKGEFFPSTMVAADIGRVFVEFFQVDRFTGKPKGILSISIDIDDAVMRRIEP